MYIIDNYIIKYNYIINTYYVNNLKKIITYKFEYV